MCKLATYDGWATTNPTTTKGPPMEQHDMVGTQIVQEVVSIMDELIAIPESLLKTFEGNGDDEPLIVMMETQDIEVILG